MCHNKKKLIPSIILVLLISAIQNTAIGQQTYDLEKVVPPSSTAAALGDYGDVPVSYYTGQASLGIPLYQIKTSQHQLNIDLSYNSSIRVNQDASWVGLGWSLKAGGVITRSVRGIDGFDNNTGTIGQGYYYAPAFLETDYDPEYAPVDTSIYRTFYINANPYGATEPDAIFLREVFERSIDAGSDIFYFNFAGHSGSFVLGKEADGSNVNISQTRYDKLQTMYVANPQVDYGNNGNAASECIPEEDAPVIRNTQAVKQIIRNIYLESITFENGHIVFETGTRKDIEERGNVAQKLSEIKVYSGKSSWESDYFDSTTVPRKYYKNIDYWGSIAPQLS